MKLYVDTNVYLDFLLERKNKEGKDLSRAAFHVFRSTAACHHTIILSDAVLNELYNHITFEETEALFSLLRLKIVRVDVQIQDKETAARYTTNDAIHIALALRAEADVVVTRNLVDFRDAIEAVLPEELI